MFAKALLGVLVGLSATSSSTGICQIQQKWDLPYLTEVGCAILDQQWDPIAVQLTTMYTINIIKAIQLNNIPNAYTPNASAQLYSRSKKAVSFAVQNHEML